MTKQELSAKLPGVCGICGKLSFKSPPQPALLGRVNQRLSHRGPDADGIWTGDHVVLGHRRLAIIDLSDAGRQPMCDWEGKIWITFNGEIYNYTELRQELITLGARFKTRTDTEVILEGYKRWGVDCLQRLNGMFALGLWDSRKETLVLARDRLGKKPLFYFLAPDGGISFASELKALREDPQVPEDLSESALRQYLTLGYVLSSHCIIKGVQKLNPAHYLVVDRRGSSKPKMYWDLAHSFQNKERFRSEKDAAQQFLALLDNAVHIRLMSDVPLGAFLSGGIDSSAVVASMCTARDPRTNFTFSTGFKEQGFSELPEAQLVAQHLGVNHCQQIVEPPLQQLLSRIVHACDEPFADTSMIPMYFLAEYTRRHVTVALSGDGADEILAGYDTYVADKLHHLTSFIPSWVTSLAQRAYSRSRKRNFGKVTADYKLLHFLRGHRFAPLRAHYSWRELFSGDELTQLLVPEHQHLIAEADPFHDFAQFGKEVPHCHFLDRAMYVDIKTWLADDILVKVDRTTMAHSLEARAPFLDYRLVEFAARLPVNLKMNGFSTKHLLRSSQKERLPRQTLSRPKRGFNSPIAHWLLGPLRAHCQELINNSPAERFINQRYIAKLLADHEARRVDNSFKLFALLNFHLWEKASRRELRTTSTRESLDDISSHSSA